MVKYLLEDFFVENNLFYIEMVPYLKNIKHVKRVLYINELYRKKASFHKLNNQEEMFVFAKMCFKCFGF